MILKLPVRFGTGILTAVCLAATAHAQNVGIGVGTPQSKLSVNGTTASGGIAVGDSTYTSTAGTVPPVGGAIIQGQVGIGTNAPLAGYKVHTFTSGYNLTLLESGGVGGGIPELQLRNDSATNREALIEMTDPTTNKGFQLGVDIFGNDTNAFTINDRAANLTRMIIDPAGNVGIGINTPLRWNNSA